MGGKGRGRRVKLRPALACPPEPRLMMLMLSSWAEGPCGPPPRADLEGGLVSVPHLVVSVSPYIKAFRNAWPCCARTDSAQGPCLVWSGQQAGAAAQGQEQRAWSPSAGLPQRCRRGRAQRARQEGSAASCSRAEVNEPLVNFAREGCALEASLLSSQE